MLPRRCSAEARLTRCEARNMADKKPKDSIEKLNFEQAIKELTTIVGKIEQGQIPLQDSLDQYERGMALIKHCREILQKAEKRIEKISEAEDKKKKKSDPENQQETEDLPF
jgi:exodeoxyribonuclease VII small subunit